MLTIDLFSSCFVIFQKKLVEVSLCKCWSESLLHYHHKPATGQNTKQVKFRNSSGAGDLPNKDCFQKLACKWRAYCESHIESLCRQHHNITSCLSCNYGTTIIKIITNIIIFVTTLIIIVTIIIAIMKVKRPRSCNCGPIIQPEMHRSRNSEKDKLRNNAKTIHLINDLDYQPGSQFFAGFFEILWSFVVHWFLGLQNLILQMQTIIWFSAFCWTMQCRLLSKTKYVNRFRQTLFKILGLVPPGAQLGLDNGNGNGNNSGNGNGK